MRNEYKELEESINNILRDIQLSDDKRKKYNANLRKIIEYLIEKMKNNPVFKELFQQVQYVGSSYENLKIGVPDEFDIDFELIIPKYVGDLQVRSSPDPGFCRLWLNEGTLSTKPKKEIVIREVKKWLDEDGYLLRSAVSNWMRSVVDVAFGKYENFIDGDEHFKINRVYSGPAVTLKVKPLSDPEATFSIDLVPVFVYDTWPSNVENLRSWNYGMVVTKWYAVPKSKEEDTNFRLCFWHQEKQLLSGKNNLKPILKLLKKLRDVNTWSVLSSYYIKTIFLWKNDLYIEYNWSTYSKSKVFMEMLREMQNYLLHRKNLPFYWNSEFDLLSQLKEETKQNIGQRIQRMIKDIERNLEKPKYLEKYFKKDNSEPAATYIEGDEEEKGFCTII